MTNTQKAIELLKKFKAGYVHIESTLYEEITNVVDSLESEPEPTERTKVIREAMSTTGARFTSNCVTYELCDIIERQAAEIEKET